MVVGIEERFDPDVFVFSFLGLFFQVGVARAESPIFFVRMMKNDLPEVLETNKDICNVSAIVWWSNLDIVEFSRNLWRREFDSM